MTSMQGAILFSRRGEMPPLTATVYAVGSLACHVFFSLPQS